VRNPPAPNLLKMHTSGALGGLGGSQIGINLGKVLAGTGMDGAELFKS
jgi:hypothetical protein